MISEHKNTEAPFLRRDLNSVHLMMIAIGSSIGTGLFVASGITISVAGPGGALFSYVLIGLMVYFLTTSLGELAAYMPVSGSFSTYGQKYIEEGFGFALGWNYWYNWAITIAVDLVSAQMIMAWWFPSIPGWIWSSLFLIIIFLMNYISVRGFGKVEYWFSIVKVFTVIIFITVGFSMIIGLFKEIKPVGWRNWTIGDAPFAGGYSSIIDIAMIVGFSFQGIELIGVAAGESENPEENIPRAVRQVFWRILLFYISTILVIGFLIPYTDPGLLNSNMKNINSSPFILVLQNTGFISAASMMNAVILAAILSTGNSGMYASTRMLYTLACEGKAPRVFSKLSRSGIPRNALYITTVITGLCFLTSLFDNKMVYLWLLNTSGTTGFIAWLGIFISHYRFRRGYIFQGKDISDLPYRSSFFPSGLIFSLILCLTITLGQQYKTFFSNVVDWKNVIAAYIGILIFLLIWLSYKMKRGTHFIRYSEMEFPDQFKK